MVTEEPEYESDPEGALLPSAMRRREASDDEDGNGSDVGERLLTRGAGSDGESDGQGGVEVYEDDEEDEEFGPEEEEEEEEENELEGLGDEEIGEGPGLDDGVGGVASQRKGSAAPVLESSGEASVDRGKDQVEEGEGERDKKESEPYAVPTVGAFYMHDDRFQENGRGRQRRMSGGRKLWESKDEQAWVHDRFEEMNLQDDHYDGARGTSRGCFRGRGNRRIRGAGRGYGQGNKPQNYNKRDNQNFSPMTVRGRGPRWYEPFPKSNNVTHATRYKQYANPQEPATETRRGRQSSQSKNFQSEPAIPHKHVFASSLSSASPPFYPSGSSNQDISMAQKRDTQLGTSSKQLLSPMQLPENFSALHSSTMTRGKATVNSVNHERVYMDNSVHLVPGKVSANSQLHSSGSSLPLISAAHSSHSAVQGKGLTINTLPSKCPTSSINQFSKVSSQAQTPIVQQIPVSTSGQPPLRVSAQHLEQQPGSGYQASSATPTLAIDPSEIGEQESPTGSSNSKTALVTKGKTSNQGSNGKGSFMYNGTQVIGTSGAMGLVHSDQGFPATPALLPVMQFGAQHGGIPAVGMALPGYVAQSQLGFGNSEMTWVPVLAGAGGALGASYGSPYIALDSSYFTRSSGQSSASVSSRESNTSKSTDAQKAPEKSDIVSDEHAQRPYKPRRYSEMDFGQ